MKAESVIRHRLMAAVTVAETDAPAPARWPPGTDLTRRHRELDLKATRACHETGLGDAALGGGRGHPAAARRQSIHCRKNGSGREITAQPRLTWPAPAAMINMKSLDSGHQKTQACGHGLQAGGQFGSRRVAGLSLPASTG